MRTYLFYDIETSGLNKCFDQVLQFAAIRTDLELNELERYNILIKLNPDVIPSPGAVITHNISLQDLQRGECEYEAIKKIHKLLNTPGTISLGYNTLGFDDEFLRFSFYRNLLTPYTHQYANECSRMDLYPITVAYFLFKTDVLQWPKIDGKSTLRLEHLSSANSLAEGAAHDALVDVETTIALARRFIKCRDMWDYLLGFFTKEIDLIRARDLSEAVMLDGMFGADNFYQCYVQFLGRHYHYKNQTLWLRLDWQDLQKTSLKEISEFTYVINRKDAEGKLLLPPKERFVRYLNHERSELIKKNNEWLAANPEVFSAIKHYYLNYKYPFIPNVDIDAALYQNGFLSSEDEMFCRKFNCTDLEEKINLLEQASNHGIRERAVRILGRNYPDNLPEKYLTEFHAHLVRINPNDEKDGMLDYKGKYKLTVAAALHEIEELRAAKNLTVRQLELLDELAAYLSK